MPRRFFLILFLAVSASAQIPMGATKQEVIDLIGWPASTSKGGNREILNYPDFMVVLENNKMTNLRFKPGKHMPLSSYLLPAPKAEPALSDHHRAGAPREIVGPNQNRVDSRPALMTAPSQKVPRVEVIAPTSTKMVVDPFAQVKSRIVWIIGLFVGLVFLKIWFEKSKQRRRRGSGRYFSAAPT